MSFKIMMLVCHFVFCQYLSESIGVPKWVTNRMSRHQKEREFFMKQTEIGIKKGLSECRRQFRWERWNCNFSEKITSKILKGRYVPKVTKEIAFMNAITSAAVTLQMARVYRRGEVSICCSKFLLKRTLKRKEESTTVIKDEETDFGLWIAEYLTDIARHQKRRRDDRELAIRHNNKIGRNVVKYMAKRRCRCHGTSGMCALQTCAGSLPTLKDVGTTLRYLYELAHKGVVHKHKELRLSGKVDAIELGDVLVYLSKSPDYCKRNTSYGLQGTLGRVCRVPHRGSTRGSMKGHCNTLCFSCGYTIKYEVKPRKVRCNCKFKWCCHVKCERCLQGEDVLVCHKR